jgi:formate C-acetyltransferase
MIKAVTLRTAQKEMELYQNLIVRITTYSDYFNNLNKVLKDEIISRIEQTDY